MLGCLEKRGIPELEGVPVVSAALAALLVRFLDLGAEAAVAAGVEAALEEAVTALAVAASESAAGLGLVVRRALAGLLAVAASLAGAALVGGTVLSTVSSGAPEKN